MGTLHFLSDFVFCKESKGILPPEWYFSDTYYDSGSGGGGFYRYNVEIDFPHKVAIHWVYLKYKSYDKEENKTKNSRKINIRRFIQRNCIGDAVLTDHDLSYERLREIDSQYLVNSWDDKWRRDKIEHGYCVFNFEEESDALLFSLKFADLASPISNRHPDRLDIPEEEIEHAANEKWKGTRW